MKPPEVVTIDFCSQQKFVVAKVMQGGMGSVYQLVPIRAGSKPVALKTIKGKSSIQSFDIECEAWFSVAHHPNIARAFAFGTWNSLPSVLVDWYSTSLAGLSPDGLSGDRIMELIGGTIDALDYAFSEMRLIHQDIKPANLLIDDQGKARLSDFGLARCVAATLRERIELGVGDIPKTATKELSGTPFYMAPELWDGVKPSVKTDVYSLGVTFFQFLTGAHPYVANMDKPVFSRQLRRGLLRESLVGKGDHAPRIEAFIARCLDLNPAARYQSYDEIGVDLPRKSPKQLHGEWTLERSEILAGAARFYSAKGDEKKATALLKRHLAERPDDPVLLQGLATLRQSLGSQEEAEKILSEAHKILRKSSGIHEGSFTPSPVFEWANCLIRAERFAEAAEVIAEALGWEDKLCTSMNTDKTILASGAHPEAGWHLLYRGDFEPAAEVLLKCAARRTLDKAQTIWLTEASWLAGTLKRQADDIAAKTLSLTAEQSPRRGELEFTWCRMLLHEYTNPILSGRLWASTPSYLFGESIKLEKEWGVKAGSLLMPKTRESQVPIVGLLDQYATGGKHNEYIRAVSKQRVE
jgi:serine/threonine protein kinase